MADELVKEHIKELQSSGEFNMDTSEPKNIRRRIYDAINVLMAMNIISKERKLLKWIGLPTNSAQEYQQYEEMKRTKQEQIAKTRAHLYDLLLQVWVGWQVGTALTFFNHNSSLSKNKKQIAFKNLIKRNEKRLAEGLDETHIAENTIQLPFIVINTDKDTKIDCQMERDRWVVGRFLNFSHFVLLFSTPPDQNGISFWFW